MNEMKKYIMNSDDQEFLYKKNIALFKVRNASLHLFLDFKLLVQSVSSCIDLNYY